MADDGNVQVVKNRPRDDAFHQQKLRMWQPILSPLHVIFIFMAIGVSFVPTGIYLSNLNNLLYEDSITYDGGGSTASNSCGITSANAGTSCDVSFTISRDIEEDINVYYELDNFYQNHRLYVNSYSSKQFMGEDVPETDLDVACTTKVRNAAGTQILNPCGLIAQSFFNDEIIFDYVNSGHTDMDQTGIAWPSDYDKFKQPDGFQAEEVAGNSVSCEAVKLPADCLFGTTSDGKSYRYYYPNEAEVEYLYETYPQIDFIKGVTDEHFMVWARTAARPNFRKLYGKIKGPFAKGQQLKFAIVNNFEVASFGGSKTLVISSLNAMGGSNPYLGTAFLSVGILAFLLTILFVIKQMISERRNMGDKTLLRWED